LHCVAYETVQDVFFLKVDVDELDQVAAAVLYCCLARPIALFLISVLFTACFFRTMCVVQAGVQSMPTFHFLKNQELVAEFSGANTKKLIELVAKHK
jgi:hypothetical protein